MIALCLSYAPTHDWSRLWTFTNYSGDAGGGVWPQSDSLLYLFALSLLLPIYTITGYDASAHTSEETYKAAHSVPRGIIQRGAVVVARSAGSWSAAIMIAIPDMAEGAKQGWSVFFYTIDAIMPDWLVQLLYLFILIAQFLCGLATVTSASRMIYAFSRDGGLPFISNWVSNGQSRNSHAGGGDLDGRCPRVPVRLDGADGFDRRDQHLHDRGERDADLPVPVASPCRSHLASLPSARPNGRRWGRGTSAFRCIGCSPCCRCSCMALIIYIAVQPPNDKVLWITLVFLVLTAIIWVLFENKRFQGPPMGEMIKKRQAEILAAEKAVGEIS